jgi:hypothetical protein
VDDVGGDDADRERQLGLERIVAGDNGPLDVLPAL